MLKIDAYSVKGTKLEKGLEIPEVKVNMEILSQAFHVYRDRSHIGFSKTKTRAEINRTTKKVYKQKGTGGARHGSRRAPIYVGGGVAHGRKMEQKSLSLPQKMRRKALDVALYLKAKNKDMVAVSGLETLKKTKEAQALLNKLDFLGKKVIVLSDKNKAVVKVLSNLVNTKVVGIKNLNAYEVVLGGKFIMDAEIWASQPVTKKEVAKVAKKNTTVVKKTSTKEKKSKWLLSHY